MSTFSSMGYLGSGAAPSSQNVKAYDFTSLIGLPENLSGAVKGAVTNAAKNVAAGVSNTANTVKSAVTGNKSSSNKSSSKSSNKSSYSKSSFASKLGISTSDLEKKAKKAGYSSTEAYYNSGTWKSTPTSSTTGFSSGFSGGSAGGSSAGGGGGTFNSDTNVLGTSSTPMAGGTTAGGTTGVTGGTLDMTGLETTGSQDQLDAADAAKQAMLAQINEEYQNAMGQIGLSENTLGQQEQSLNEQLPITEGQITNSYGETAGAIQNEQSTKVGGLQNQQVVAEQSTENILNKARRTFNELSSGISRFAGSAAQGYGEILGRSVADQMGEARQNLATTLNSIQSELTNTQTYYASKMTELEKGKNLAIEQARKDYRDELSKVSTARMGLNENKLSAQRWKATQNLTALSSFQQTVAQIKSAAEASAQALAMWKIEQQNALSTKAAESTKTTQTMIDNMISNMQENGSVSNNQILSAYGQVGQPVGTATSNLQGILGGTSGSNEDSLIDKYSSSW